jgi:hypothetical protein
VAPWPTVDDVKNRLGIPPADVVDDDAIVDALAGQTAYVLRARPDLCATPGDVSSGPVADVDDDERLGVLILAALDYRARNASGGFTGYDGGQAGGDAPAERFRAQVLLRIDRHVPPRVG